MSDQLRQEALGANLGSPEHNLNSLYFGESAIARDAGAFAIKPSGMPYRELSASKMVIVTWRAPRSTVPDKIGP
jgi:L-ribulose-5-phosphate 4-epimerase